ncbi:GRAS [Ancistrocladus abbreviatus]
MQKSQQHQSSGRVHRTYHQPGAEISPYWPSHFQLVGNIAFPDNDSQGTEMSIQAFTLESSPATTGYVMYDSPSVVSASSNRSTFSPQGSQSYISDLHHSSENTSGSPISWSSGVDDDYELRNKLRELDISMLGPGPGTRDGNLCTFGGGVPHKTVSPSQQNLMMESISMLDLKQVLILCAQAVSEEDLSTASSLMGTLGHMVSVSGSPIERLAAYMLEGLRARVEFSGYTIYRKLRCEQPTSKELLSYMHILYQICPYYKFAYFSSNVIIKEATENESKIHIIDFQIAMGSQWIYLIESLANRPGGPPFLRITGVDDSHSAYARGGGLDIVGQRLSKVAKSCAVPFEFHAAAMSGCQVDPENLGLRPGEALAVNFPFMLHHMPDESVSTVNHRDRLLRLVKSLSPKVVTLVEQESNTNTAPFFNRFREMLDYYTAMFESIDVALPRDDTKRINAEQHCLARDIVNMIACEGAERVERHELLGKWKARYTMAGFAPYPLSPSVGHAVRDLLRDYHENYRIQEHDGAFYLGWKKRWLVTLSAWR